MRAGMLGVMAALLGGAFGDGAPAGRRPVWFGRPQPRRDVGGGRPTTMQVEEYANAPKSTAKRFINPARRERKALGLSGRQWRKYRKAARAAR